MKQEFIFPADIMAVLQNQTKVWKNFQKCSSPYQRIRIAYIEAARKLPEEFEKHLANFMQKTAKKSSFWVLAEWKSIIEDRLCKNK